MWSKKKIAHGIIGTKGGKMGVTLLFQKKLLGKNYNLTNQLEIKSGLKVSRSLKHILNFQVWS